MKHFKITIILLFSLKVISFADTVVPYYGITEYSNSVKDEATNYGLYYSSQSTKILYDYQDVKYLSDSNISDFSQTNIAFQYNFNASNSTNFYTALNYINSSNNEYDGSYVVLLGMKEKFSSFDLGLNYSYSNYNNTLVKTVQQLSPSLSFSYGDHKSFMGNYHLKVFLDLIYPNANSNINGISSSYSPYGLSLTQSKGRFQNSIKYYTGEHMFAVRNDGMSVQNFEEIYTGSFSLSCKYNFSQDTSMQLSYIVKDFFDYGATSEAEVTSTILFLYYKF